MGEKLSSVIPFSPWNFYQTKITNLNHTSIDQDASAESVENSTDDARGRAVRVVRRADAKTDRNAWIQRISIRVS